MKKPLELVLTTLALALGGCDVGQTSGPLVEEKVVQPVGPSPGAAGQAGTTTQPGVGAPGCWADDIPAEPQALAPTHTVEEACALGANGPQGAFPQPGTGGSTRNVDRRGEIVGRWTACGAIGVNGQPHAGIEFGGNGRWQVLARNPSGALVPANPPQRGYYYLLESGQLNLSGDGPHVDGIGGGFLHFAAGKDALLFEAGGGIQPFSATYARTMASPSNGADNAPTVSDGRCSMVGSWDVPANAATPTAPASTWSFDASGRFVVTPRGGDVCATPSMYGTYQLSGGHFQLTTNFNLGLCDWWFAAAYPATFDASCNTMTLVQKWDNCTGGRGYLNGTTTLTRKR